MCIPCTTKNAITECSDPDLQDILGNPTVVWVWASDELQLGSPWLNATQNPRDAKALPLRRAHETEPPPRPTPGVTCQHRGQRRPSTRHQRPHVRSHIPPYCNGKAAALLLNNCRKMKNTADAKRLA